MKDLKLKIMYNNVISQAISESGRFLFAGNRFGDIFAQDLHDLEKTDTPRSKVLVFPQPSQTEINSLCCHRDFLIVGAIGVVYGLSWDEEKRELSTARKWEVKIPLNVDAVEVPDVNFLWLRTETDTLYAGCGDNIIYQINLEDGHIVRDYRGHTDYIHGVAGSDRGRIFSASEDGTVRFWSEQQKEATAKLEPSANAQLMRPEYGKWIGAVATNDDWLICGGGPKFSIWHLGTMECMRDFEFPGKVHVCDFVEENLFVAGEHSHAQFYAINGDIQANIPLEHTAAYSAVWQLEPIKFMSIAGYSNKLHILNDFRFLDSKIELYGNTEE